VAAPAPAREAAPASQPAPVVEIAPAEGTSADSKPATSRPAGRTTRIVSALRTDRGQDSGAMVPERRLFMVAAGVGRAPGGGRAAARATDAVRKAIEGEPVPSSRRGKGLPALVAAIEQASASIYAEGRRDAALRGMGATFAAVLAMGRAAGLAHVGDSR